MSEWRAADSHGNLCGGKLIARPALGAPVPAGRRCQPLHRPPPRSLAPHAILSASRRRARRAGSVSRPAGGTGLRGGGPGWRQSSRRGGSRGCRTTEPWLASGAGSPPDRHPRRPLPAPALCAGAVPLLSRTAITRPLLPASGTGLGQLHRITASQNHRVN